MYTRPGITQLTAAPKAGRLSQTTNETEIQTQSSADGSTTTLSPVHQRGKKPHLILPELKRETRPTQSSHKPLGHTYEGRNQKEQRIQPQSLGKGGLKHSKFEKKKTKRQRNTAEMKEQPRKTLNPNK